MCLPRGEANKLGACKRCTADAGYARETGRHAATAATATAASLCPIRVHWAAAVVTVAATPQHMIHRQRDGR